MILSEGMWIFTGMIMEMSISNSAVNIITVSSMVLSAPGTVSISQEPSNSISISIKYVKLDTRKVPEEVCNDIKVAFRAGNIFIRTDSEEDVRTARKQFGFWRRKKYMGENSPKP